MDRPRQRTVERDGTEIVIGEDGDFSWDEIDAIKLQIDRWNAHHPKDAPVRKMPAGMIKAVLEVKQVFPGAVIEDWS
jgi:hypothetical protein